MRKSKVKLISGLENVEDVLYRLDEEGYRYFFNGYTDIDYVKQIPGLPKEFLAAAEEFAKVNEVVDDMEYLPPNSRLAKAYDKLEEKLDKEVEKMRKAHAHG